MQIDGHEVAGERLPGLIRIVDKNKCFLVDVVHYQVKVAVVVKVSVCGAVRHRRLVDVSRFRLIFEGQIMAVDEQIIRKLYVVKSGQLFPDCFFLVLPAAVTGKDTAAKFEEVSVDKIPSDSVCDVYVFPSIVIKISQ